MAVTVRASSGLHGSHLTSFLQADVASHHRCRVNSGVPGFLQLWGAHLGKRSSATQSNSSKILRQYSSKKRLLPGLECSGENAAQWRVVHRPMQCHCAATQTPGDTLGEVSKTSHFNDGSATSFAPLLNGCWSLQGSPNDILHTMSQHAEAGLTTFDTADIYGRSETYLGEFRDAWAQRREADSHLPEVQLFTKFVPDIFRNQMTPRFVEAAIKKSLAALRTPKVDLVQMHWWDYEIPGLLDAAKCLADLQSRGLITSIGLTNINTETLAAVVDAGVTVVSNQFSLLDRRPQKEMLTYAKEKDIKIFTYGTLAGGLLSDRYNDPGEKDLLGRVRYKPVGLTNNSLKMYWPNVGAFGGQSRWRSLLELLASLAAKHDVSTANVALRWAMDQGPVFPIVGMRSAAHIEDNLRVLRLKLDTDDMAKLNGFLEESGTRPGDCYDQERGS